MKNYEILLFDADNTLFDFDASERMTYFEFAPEFGITPNEETYELYRKFNLESWAEIEKNTAPKEELLKLRYVKLFNALGVSGEPSKANAEFLRILSTKGVLYPQTIHLLKKLKSLGKRIYLITNGVAEVQDGRIAATDTMQYFDGIFISEVLGASKPSREFFEKATLSIPNFDKGSTVVIGDSLTSDIQGANNFELDCIWFNPSNKPTPNNLKIDYIATSLEEIEELLSTPIEQ